MSNTPHRDYENVKRSIAAAVKAAPDAQPQMVAVVKPAVTDTPKTAPA